MVMAYVLCSMNASLCKQIKGRVSVAYHWRSSERKKVEAWVQEWSIGGYERELTLERRHMGRKCAAAVDSSIYISQVHLLGVARTLHEVTTRHDVFVSVIVVS
jgi:hypothetical protein